MIKRDGCGRRLSELVQCQSCGYCVEQVDDSLPEGWSAARDGRFYCDVCPDGDPVEEDRPLLGYEYDEEFDQEYWGKDDIGRRAPCDGYFVA